MQLTFKNVSHTYQPGSPFQATALHDVSFTIKEGEFVALIGHTGSGKSTLAQHMNALLTPTEGEVLLDDRNINGKDENKREIRKKIGLVFQYPEHQLFEETVYKDVAFGPKNLGLKKEEIDERVREALENVGLSFDDVKEKSPFELSGGQMRRVAMAGVLAMRPFMLVLDEPTAGLDPMGRDEILSMVKSLHQKGTTILLVSHSMDDVAQVADRIIVMEKGTVKMDDIPQNIFSRGEELVQMGLDIPETLKLSLALQKCGFDFPFTYKKEDALVALKKILKKEEK